MAVELAMVLLEQPILAVVVVEKGLEQVVQA
jgi:hypothetical protein